MGEHSCTGNKWPWEEEESGRGESQITKGGVLVSSGTVIEGAQVNKDRGRAIEAAGGGEGGGRGVSRGRRRQQRGRSGQQQEGQGRERGGKARQGNGGGQRRGGQVRNNGVKTAELKGGLAWRCSGLVVPSSLR